MNHSICRTITVITFFLFVIPSNLLAQTDEYTAYDKAKFISDYGVDNLKSLVKILKNESFVDTKKLRALDNLLNEKYNDITDFEAIDIEYIKVCAGRYILQSLSRLDSLSNRILDLDKEIQKLKETLQPDSSNQSDISVFNDDLAKKLSFLKTLYESTKKEQDNILKAFYESSSDVATLYKASNKNNKLNFDLDKIKITSENYQTSKPNNINIIFPQGSSKQKSQPSASIQTQVIEGLTLFIVDRAKQELTLQYFTKLWKITNSPELNPLFPNTLLMLENVDKNTLPTIGSMWRTALFLDLKSMPDSLFQMALRNNMIDKQTVYKLKLGKQIFRMYKGLQKGAHPTEIINSICDSLIKEDNSLRFMQTAKIISNSFYSTEDGKWVSPDDIQKLGNDGVKILASLYLRKVADDPTYQNRLIKLSTEITRIKGFVRQFNAVQSIITDLSQNNSFTDSLYSQSYGKYLLLYSDVLKTVIREAENNSNKKNDLETLFKTIDTFADVTDALNKQQFGKVSFLLYAYSTKVSKENPILPSKFMKIASFVSDISEAKTSEDVKSIIEAAAVPVGEWREKRTDVNYIYLQSYLGIGFGREIFQNQIPGFYTGLQAPVGIEFQNSCFRLFISLLDLGAVANYHVSFADNDSVKSIPEVGFAQVVSPGLFFIHHLEDNPITWGIGFSFSPQLREIKNSNAVLRDGFLNSYKVGAFLAVDIPIWRLN